MSATSDNGTSITITLVGQKALAAAAADITPGGRVADIVGLRLGTILQASVEQACEIVSELA